MTRSLAHPTSEIDEALRRCCSARRAAQAELGEVRRRQAELAELEVQLLVAIEVRCRRADRLLDDRLHAVTDATDRSPRVAGDRRPLRTAAVASSRGPREVLRQA